MKKKEPYRRISKFFVLFLHFWSLTWEGDPVIGAGDVPTEGWGLEGQGGGGHWELGRGPGHRAVALLPSDTHPAHYQAILTNRFVAYQNSLVVQVGKMKVWRIVEAVHRPCDSGVVLGAAQGRGGHVWGHKWGQMTRLLHYLTWTHDLGDGDVPLPSGGDTALGQTQLSTVITRHLEIISIIINIIIIITST